MSEQPDPLDPTSWPTEPPKEDGLYFIVRRDTRVAHDRLTPPETADLFSSPNGYRYVRLAHRESADNLTIVGDRLGIRWFPIPLTPQAVRAQHGSGGMGEEVARQIESAQARARGVLADPNCLRREAELCRLILAVDAAKLRARGREPGAGGTVVPA